MVQWFFENENFAARETSARGEIANFFLLNS